MSPTALLFAAVLLLSQFASNVFAAEPPKRVLILDSLGRDVAPFSVVVSALRSELNRQWAGPLDIYEVSLEAGRSPQPEEEEAVTEFLARRLDGHPVDVVIPVALPALRFAARHRERLFPTAPLVITAVDPRRMSPDLMMSGSVSVTYQGNLTEAVRGILEILPDTQKIHVIFGASQIEKFWKAESEREFALFSDRVEFDWWNHLSFAEMQKRVVSLPPNSVILYGLLLRDSAGVAIDQERAVRELAAAANSPVVGYFQSQMGLGIVGGRLLPDRSLGQLAADVVTRILRGEPPSEISVKPLRSLEPTYDWRELNRFGIEEARLPTGSAVLYRSPSIWETYRWHLVGIGGLVMLQSLLITGLLAQRVRRARAERALVANEQKLMLITHSLPVLIAYVDREQRYQFNNLAFQAWFDVDAETVRGKAMWTVLGERLYQRVRPYAERALSGQHVSFSIDTVLDDGRRLAVEGIHVPDPDEGGGVRGFHALMMDVTARNQARQEAGELRAELMHAGRVSLMGVLSAALAHELNQPLTAIMSNAQAARRFLNSPTPNLREIAEILDDIALDDERASEVIRRLRALVKKKPTDFQSLDVAETIRGVERMVHSDAMLRHVAVNLEIDPGLPRICGDRVQLQQVLLNLVINAFEASEGSTAGDRIVTIGARRDNGQVVLDVRDRGTGICQEIYDTLFEPFHSSKKQGLGMGLSICKSIVERHNGRLWAENNPDGGATFYLSLPADRAAAAAEGIIEDTQHGEPVADRIRS
jgi:PAS domain S-box-containing protein